MRVDVLSIFPQLFPAFLAESLIGKARERGLLDISVHDLRDWAPGKHRAVDDAPYGGGAGMVMAAPPVFAAVEAIAERGPQEERPHVVLMSPQGRRFDQGAARELAARPWLLLVCGRYEGFDERIRSLADEEVSIGDYVLAGGELPALVVLEAVSRLVPGVVGDAESVVQDSFYAGILDYPHYTRPAEFRGQRVPDELLSGHHEEIRIWRKRMALAATLARRPDLLENASLDPESRELLAQLRSVRG